MQWPKDWLVRVRATPSLGTTSKVFSHHSLISLSVLATLTSKEEDLPENHERSRDRLRHVIEKH